MPGQVIFVILIVFFYLISTELVSIKHAVCLYGFDEDANSFLFKNSSSEETTIKVPLSETQVEVTFTKVGF